MHSCINCIYLIRGTTANYYNKPACSKLHKYPKKLYFNKCKEYIDVEKYYDTK